MQSLYFSDHVTIDCNACETIDLDQLEEQLNEFFGELEQMVCEVQSAGFECIDESNHETWDDYESAREFLDTCRANGCTAVPESYFAEMARELAQEMAPFQVSFDEWPYNLINWDEAAERLQEDYTPVDWHGRTFYVQ